MRLTYRARHAPTSVDTVKTRLQGQPLNRSSIKYHNMVQAYKLIFKEEGVFRGLYAGVTPAMLGSSKDRVLMTDAIR